MSFAERLAGGIDTVVDLIGRAAAWLCLTLALVMGANVLLRYAFSIGSIWMQELEWHLLVPICLLGISYTLLNREHVRVDVVFQYLPPKSKSLVEAISAVLGMLFAAAVIWLSIAYVYQSWSNNEGTANPGGIEARYIIKSLIPIGFALYFLQSLSEAIKHWLAYRKA
ncbi:MAG: TRAP transporter small permease subunit [Pseudolabrys sp.]|nr:TRAP transporter small permease subunit [Pseudolabrys sp.]